MIVQVTDDGRGQAGANVPGLGFTGMRERIAALGGTLQIGNGMNATGFAVTARLPTSPAMVEA